MCSSLCWKFSFFAKTGFQIRQICRPHDIDIRVPLHGQITLDYLLLLSIVGETILREENQTWHITQYFSSDWPYAIRKTDGMTLQSLSLTLQISDLNINTIIIKSEMKNFQSLKDDKLKVQTVESRSLIMSRRVYAKTQHMTKFQTSSEMGMDYGSYSAPLKMVMKISKILINNSDAPKSTGTTDDLSLTTDTTCHATTPSVDTTDGATVSTDLTASRVQ